MKCVKEFNQNMHLYLPRKCQQWSAAVHSVTSFNKLLISERQKPLIIFYQLLEDPCCITSGHLKRRTIQTAMLLLFCNSRNINKQEKEDVCFHLNSFCCWLERVYFCHQRYQTIKRTEKEICVGSKHWFGFWSNTHIKKWCGGIASLSQTQNLQTVLRLKRFHSPIITDYIFPPFSGSINLSPQRHAGYTTATGRLDCAVDVSAEIFRLLYFRYFID